MWCNRPPTTRPTAPPTRAALNRRLLSPVLTVFRIVATPQAGCARNKPPKPALPGRPFDFGVWGNLAKVFGRHPFLWLLPTNQGIEGNGIFFEPKMSLDGGREAGIFPK